VSRYQQKTRMLSERDLEQDIAYVHLVLKQKLRNAVMSVY